MRLDKVSGESIYVDTNVLYMYLRADPNHLPTITAFLERVVRGEMTAYVGIPVVDELFYRLLLARVRESTDRNPLDLLREDSAGVIATHSHIIEAAIRRLMDLPQIELVGVDISDFDKMLENIRIFRLLPRDALHLAILQRLGLKAIASDDFDFDRVEGLERYWIINPPPI
jgi:predicted nucleic acid-binding protein